MPLRIDFQPYRRSFLKPLRTARGEWAVRDGFILRVEGPEGVGFGEVAPIPEFGSETTAEAGDFLRRLNKEPHLAVPKELPCCAFALSAALARPETKRNSYPVSGLLPAGAAAEESLQTKWALGFRNFKWKVGVEPVGTEQAIFAKLCQGLPEGVRLRLDANGCWDLKTLQNWARFLQDHRTELDYLEQPLAVGQEAVMRSVAEETQLPIALDESLQGPSGRQWLQPGAWCGPLVIKPALMGDVASLRTLLRPIATQVVLSSVFETTVGVANALSLAELVTGNLRPLGFDTAGAFDDDLSLPIEAASLSLSRDKLDLLWETLSPHSN